MKKVLSLLTAAILLVIVASCNPQRTKSDCDVLKGQTTIDNCYFEKAIATADIAFCKRITMTPLREACISEISASMNDITLCKDLEKQAKGSCYSKIAANNQNESICQLIESDYWWDICHYNLGIAKNSEGICFEMHDSDKADECFTKIAESKKDEQSCSWILKFTTEYSCYTKLALIKGNASICDRIDNSVSRNGNCIKKVAENLSDSSICERITISNIKQDCLDKFKKQ